MHLALKTFVVVAAVAISLGNPARVGAQTTLVTTDGAVLREGGNDAAAAVATLPRHTPVQLWAGMSQSWPEWLLVRATILPAGQQAKGWIRTRDLWLSQGWERLWWREYGRAAVLLRAEADLTPDATIAAWLKLQRGFALAGLGQLDDAVAALDGVARARPASALTPFAYLAVARLHLTRHDLPAMLRAYESLLQIAPSYTVPLEECKARASVGDNFCSGEPAIATRVAALRPLLVQQAATDRVAASNSATPLEKSAAWYALGEAWEKKNTVDPGFQETGVPNDDPRRCYEQAVLAAPHSAVAGTAAWRLIGLSGPYEWEGDIAARTEWTLKQFGAFLRDYPDHLRAGEALYEMATATWANGGYPEAFHYMFAPGGWPSLGPRRQFLEQWFDTRGFGGGTGPLPVPEREEAARALALFKDVVQKYPGSNAAPKAQYYAAVILDFCLNDKARALQEFEVFLKLAPQLEPFASKANARVVALRK